MPHYYKYVPVFRLTSCRNFKHHPAPDQSTATLYIYISGNFQQQPKTSLSPYTATFPYLTQHNVLVPKMLRQCAGTCHALRPAQYAPPNSRHDSSSHPRSLNPSSTGGLLGAKIHDGDPDSNEKTATMAAKIKRSPCRSEASAFFPARIWHIPNSASDSHDLQPATRRGRK